MVEDLPAGRWGISAECRVQSLGIYSAIGCMYGISESGLDKASGHMSGT